MLRSMEDYRTLVQKIGVKGAQEILASINDLVAFGERGLNTDIKRLALKTEVFRFAFMRNSESFFAYKNAGSLIRGLSYEQKGLLPPTIAIQFQLAGRNNPHDLCFKFDHTADLPKRLAVIIGKNGVGKSQTLGRIVKAAIKGDKSLTDGISGDRLAINRIMAFATTNETDSVFPSDNQKNSRVWYRR